MHSPISPTARLPLFALIAVAAGLSACRPSVRLPAGPSETDLRAGLHIVGDPASDSGATWSYRGRQRGVDYDLEGVLYKPAGAGPFPAVLLSHGARGNAAFYARGLAPEMVGWGLVCIATNYTHAGGVPIGAPGRPTDRGASPANLVRAHMTYELLATLGYVDMTRVAAHGHSMGAYVTAALLGAYPTDFRVASHTGGGVRPPRVVAGPAPGEAQIRGIRRPYQIHHGELDAVVPLAYDERLASILGRLGVSHELHVYPGADHLAPSRSPLMLQRLRQWYAANGIF